MNIKEWHASLLQIVDQAILLRCGTPGVDHKVVYKRLRARDFLANNYGTKFDVLNRIKRSKQ